MQADPIKPTLKAPGTKRLKLVYDGLLSSFAFKFKLRRYTVALAMHPNPDHNHVHAADVVQRTAGGLHSFPFQLNLSTLGTQSWGKLGHVADETAQVELTYSSTRAPLGHIHGLSWVMLMT